MRILGHDLEGDAGALGLINIVVTQHGMLLRALKLARAHLRVNPDPVMVAAIDAAIAAASEVGA